MMDRHPDSSTSVSERASHPAEAGESAAAADSPGPERLAALVDLGRKLAEARQAQGIPLPVLAEQNYLSADRLDALECGDHTRLPERIYLIAQARRVATSLGLDADELTEPLLNIHLPGVSRSARTNPASPAPGQTSAPVARVSLAAPAMAPRESSTGALLQSTRKPRRGAMPWLLAGAPASWPWRRVWPWAGTRADPRPASCRPHRSPQRPEKLQPPPRKSLLSPPLRLSRDREVFS